MTGELAMWAKNAFNSTLARVDGKIYAYGESLHFERPQAVRFRFSGTEGITFFCHSDGETLTWDTSELSEVDLDEYGKELVVNLADHAPWSRLIGRTLTSVSEIVSPDGPVIGYEFIFKPDGNLLLLNLGNEMAVFDEPQEVILKEESFLSRRYAPPD
ncbi:hypothetical protein [Ensifer aridi]|uniref:hypothetical protein n=1 Tax=Ensifer aridi TaxID=1708715 RepID=UPI00358E9F46